MKLKNFNSTFTTIEIKIILQTILPKTDKRNSKKLHN